MQRKGGSRPDTSGTDVEAALDELYATLPSAFTARREELAAAARTAGRPADARRIHAARRPTLPAWAANLLLRSRPEESLQFLRLGQALRDAYRTLDPAGIKELSAQRQHVVAALSRQAAQLAAEAGYRLSESVQRDVESTLRAVLADPDAAAQFASGRLHATLAPPSEFPTATAAATGAAPKPSQPAPAPESSRARAREDLARQQREHQQQLDQARQTAAAAEQQLRERRAEHGAAKTTCERSRERHRQAQHRAAAAEEKLQQAREDLAAADREQHQAEERLGQTADALARAEQEARTAAAEADRLARSAPR